MIFMVIVASATRFIVPSSKFRVLRAASVERLARLPTFLLRSADHFGRPLKK
jgi:hypothetical protein